MNRYPTFSDKQFRRITAAAARLPRSERKEFLSGVARRLGNEPSDEAVEAAITAQLAQREMKRSQTNETPPHN